MLRGQGVKAFPLAMAIATVAAAQQKSVHRSQQTHPDKPGRQPTEGKVASGEEPDFTRFRVVTDDGILVVYDADEEWDGRDEPFSQLAYWHDYQSESLFFFDQLLFDSDDVVQSIATMQRDLQIDPAHFLSEKPELDPLPEITSPGQWRPAVEEDVLVVMAGGQLGARESGQVSGVFSPCAGADCDILPAATTGPIGGPVRGTPNTQLYAMAQRGSKCNCTGGGGGCGNCVSNACFNATCDPNLGCVLVLNCQRVDACTMGQCISSPTGAVCRTDSFCAEKCCGHDGWCCQNNQTCCERHNALGGCCPVGLPACCGTKCCVTEADCCNGDCKEPGDVVCGPTGWLPEPPCVSCACNSACCGASCCGPQCCTDPCACNPACCGDPCCGDPCCVDPCACNPACCGDPCCGDPCCNDPDPCCGNPDPCCDNDDPCDPQCGDPCAPGCADCDDGDPCTTDLCNGGQCSHPPKCPAGVPCCNGVCRTGCQQSCCNGAWYDGPCCGNGGCEAAQVCCNGTCCGTNGCHPGLCVNNNQCVILNACDDGNVCTDDPCTVSQCGDFFCPPSTNNSRGCTDDGNLCTNDICAGGTCAHPCKPPCTLACVSGPSWGYCVDCECEASGCSVSLASGSGRPCQTKEITLTADCWPDCGGTSFEFTVFYPPGFESLQPWLDIDGPGSIQCSHEGFQLLPVNVTVHENAPPGNVTIKVRGTTSKGETCETSAKFNVLPLTITAEHIDQDEPTNTTWVEIPQFVPIYGGSEGSTADNLRLTVTPSLGGVSNIVWSWEGPGSATFSSPPSGPSATQWDLANILNPVPGLITFKVVITYADGNRECGEFKFEIAVRTDDVIVVGWIDPDNVPLNPTDVHAQLLTLFPPSGPPVGINTPKFMFQLVGGDIVPLGIPLDSPANDVNRLYVLHWMFKFAANPDPRSVTGPLDFRDSTDTHIDVNKIGSFLSVSTNYKLFQRFQVKFRANHSGFVGTPTLLKSLYAIGWTQDPTWNLGLLPGQSGPNNGKFDRTAQSIWQVNEGSPDAQAVKAFNTLMGNAVPMNPKFWESIGSRIRFRFDGGTEPVVSLQVYPTYYRYRNGRRIGITPQLPDPKDVFRIYPYPFGAVPCTSIQHPHAQGRCGDAHSTEDLTARIPPFLP